MREFWIMIGYIAFLSFGLGFVGGYFLDKQKCRARAEMMEFNYSYGVFQGCMIRVQEVWVPIENYRVNDPGVWE